MPRELGSAGKAGGLSRSARRSDDSTRSSLCARAEIAADEAEGLAERVLTVLVAATKPNPAETARTAAMTSAWTLFMLSTSLGSAFDGTPPAVKTGTAPDKASEGDGKDLERGPSTAGACGRICLCVC